MTEATGSERPEGELESYVPANPAETSPDAPRRRRTATTVALGIGVAVAVVAGVVALATLTSDGGSATPEAAVRKMADAVANEDVLGALDALVPAEREVVRDRLFDITAELGRLGVLEDKVDLAHVRGADVTVSGLELTTEPLSDDLAAVLVTGGSAGLSFTPADLPAGPLFDDFLRSPEPVRDTTPLGDDDDVRVVTVREGGDWFVSLGYTLAESVRRDSDAGELRVDKAVTPKGAGSPERAVEEFAAAAAALDTRRLVELAAPGESAALQTYAPPVPRRRRPVGRAAPRPRGEGHHRPAGAVEQRVGRRGPRHDRQAGRCPEQPRRPERPLLRRDVRALRPARPAPAAR